MIGQLLGNTYVNVVNKAVGRRVTQVVIALGLRVSTCAVAADMETANLDSHGHIHIHALAPLRCMTLPPHTGQLTRV